MNNRILRAEFKHGNGLGNQIKGGLGLHLSRTSQVGSVQQSSERFINLLVGIYQAVDSKIIAFVQERDLRGCNQP